ncbi:FAD-dependent monooxygenase [Actinosynnema sp. NPDC059797]
MRVLISGAGITGLALAHRLGTLGHDVVVLEQSPAPRTAGYMIDFFGPGYDAAERMGVLPRLRELGYRVVEAAYLDDRGRRVAGMRFDRVARAVDGRLLSIMRPDLERAFREDLPATVGLRFAARVVGVEQDADRVTARLADGTTATGDLLVGADGVHSAVRRLVFGEGHLRHLGFHTAAFVFDDPHVHELVRDRFCLTDTVGRQVGFYGLRDGRVAAFTVHRTSSPDLPEDPRAAVLETYGSLGWVVPRALARCPAEIYYDQVAQVELPRWSSGRVVLAGDACGAVSLLAGQGASLGIGGAWVLASHLDDPAAYERAWRPVVEDRQRVARSGARWFLPDSPLRLRARRVAMRLSHLPGVDRLITTSLVGKPVTIG